MTIFDQRGQKVTYQFNVAGDINLGAVENRQEAVVQLQKLIAEIEKAAQAGVIPEDAAVDAEHQLKKAVLVALKPEGDKKIILEYLGKAKTFVENLAAAGGLVQALMRREKWFRSSFEGRRKDLGTSSQFQILPVARGKGL
jgi:hypothetical protein